MGPIEFQTNLIETIAPAKIFHKIFSCGPHHMSNVSHREIQGVVLHEDGKTKVAMAIVKAIDEKNNSVTFEVIEGDLMEEYKNIKITVQATPKGEGSLVHWTLEYEKLHENIGEPNTLLQLALDLSKDLDAHLVRA
ncbi:hypothetical protein ACJW30_03G079900 [Castanea mollissima]